VEVPRQTLAEIIEPRVEETLGLVNREVIRSGFADKCSAGVVLTGGASLLPGIEELGELVFEMPVRAGRPVGIGGLIDVVNSPMYASGVGLVIYGSKNQGRRNFRIRNRNIFKRVVDRMREGVAALVF